MILKEVEELSKTTENSQIKSFHMVPSGKWNYSWMCATHRYLRGTVS